MDFKIKNEKEWMLWLFDTHWKFFKWWNEDDFIMRYFVYRWLFERILSKHKDFQFMNAIEEKNGAKSWLNLFSKIPSKYEQLLVDVDKEIEEHTLNIEPFKQWILDYLDDDQKAWLNQYKDIVIDKTMSWIKDVTLYDYIQQIEYEFITISYLNFSWYFTITMDYVLYSKLHNIAVWPWRWSAAWSIIAYLMYITDCDALKFELLFERMLHILKAKNDIPDIDLDFETSKRYDVIDYVKNKFWDENVCHVWNYINTKIKWILKDLTRKTDIPFQDINKISSWLWTKPEDIQQNFNYILEYYQWWDVPLDESITALLSLHRKILEPIINIVKDQCWFPKMPWIHACWIIISPVPIETICWCRYLPETKAKIWLFYKTEMESAWLLKFDFLWLQNMEMIKNTIKSIIWKNEDIQKKYWIVLQNKDDKEWDNINWYWMYYDILDNIWKNDSDVFENIFQLWLTIWIFQFESQWMQNIMKWIKPQSITELGDLNALYRPWPLAYIPTYKDSKFEWLDIQIYPNEFVQKMERKYWKEKTYECIEYFENIWRKVTIDTKNIFIYQEQLMFFFYLLWHSYTDADAIRKIYSKIRWWKKKFSDLDKYYKKTKEILEWLDIKMDFFDYIYYEIFLDWASYWFNKSHSTCYAVIAYISWWLKYYYPYEFYSALLRTKEWEPESIWKIINEMNILWIEINWPSILHSSKHPIIL